MSGRKFGWIIVVVFVSALLVAGCGAPAATTPSAPAAATSAASKPAWQQDWDATVAAARKEGMLMMYTTDTSAELTEAIRATMSDKFGIKVDHLVQTGTELSAKVLAERRAGLYLPDVYTGGGTTLFTNMKPVGALAPLKPLLVLPEVLDQNAYFGNKLPFSDNDKNLVVTYGPAVAQTVSVNTDQVKPGDIKTNQDLLNPKWKDKIVMYDPTLPGVGFNWFVTVGVNRGMDFHRQFVKQNPVVTRNKRLVVEWAARGKYPVAIGASKYIVAEFATGGAPINWAPTPDGVYLGSVGSLAVYDRAPHPNAARVFANWILSKEGMTLWSKVTLMSVARKDVPFDFLEPATRRDPGMEYFDKGTEEAELKNTQYMELVRQIYGPLVK